MDHFCLSVSGVSQQELCAYLASWSIQHSEIATRYGAQGFGRSLYLSDPEGSSVDLKLAA